MRRNDREHQTVRVSKCEQTPELQRGELLTANCQKVLEENISSRVEKGFELGRTQAYCLQGDVLVVRGGAEESRAGS